ncbi:hypothetical protein Taro_041456 [Colocasia esculenta]|uniref:cysteine dioxygenase n=1 Tax=Colocasia esculenta TaxID=4460 RepID=A0A843WLQ7_COLES|nr:hypothetical protein [Colocasia esculenta]
MEGASLMKVEGGFSERAGSPSSGKGKKRQRKPRPALVQKLYDTCREVFSRGEAGGVPSPADVERLCCLLDKIKGKDVNVTESMPYFEKARNNGRPPVTYIRLHECDNFSICIFCLPQSSVIPLHNHPGMTVFSKLLFGTLHVKSYDWADGPDHVQANASDLRTSLSSSHTLHIRIYMLFAAAHPAASVRLAKVETNEIFRYPRNTSVLYPTSGGNMHCFTAFTSCAVLDVLGPPYSKDDTRPCTYYNDYPCSSFSGMTLRILIYTRVGLIFLASYYSHLRLWTVMTPNIFILPPTKRKKKCRHGLGKLTACSA